MRSKLVTLVWFLALFFCAPTFAIMMSEHIALAQDGSVPPAGPQLWLALAGVVMASPAMIDAWIVKKVKALLWQNLLIALVGPVMGAASGAMTQLAHGANMTTAWSFFAGTCATAASAAIVNWIVSSFGSNASGGGSTKLDPVIEKGGARGSAPVLKMVSILALLITVVGCKDLSPKLPADLQSVETCVVGELESGSTDAGAIAAKCAPGFEQAAWDEIAFLLDSGVFKSSHPSAVAPLSTALSQHIQSEGNK